LEWKGIFKNGRRSLERIEKKIADIADITEICKIE
jgi:hypothetical protein